MPPDPPAEASRPASPRGRIGKWLAAAAIFAAGALAAGLPVGLLSGGSSAGGGPGPSSAPSQPAGGAAGQITVNTSCVEAIHDARTVRAQLSQLALAAQHLNFGKLDQIVRKLEPIQNRLNADSRACRIVAVLPSGAAVTAAPAVPSAPVSSSPSPARSAATP